MSNITSNELFIIFLLNSTRMLQNATKIIDILRDILTSLNHPKPVERQNNKSRARIKNFKALTE